MVQQDLQDGRAQQTGLISMPWPRCSGRDARSPKACSSCWARRATQPAAGPAVARPIAALHRPERWADRLTEAAISKHLKLLQDAGWVTPERRSYYVYYRLVRESLTDLSHGLEQMLG